MNLLLIQKPGSDLYSLLLASETSRNILKFYPPERVPHGVSVTSASLGSTLSLVSELRWYIRRYVQEVLFEIGDDLYCTHDLALEIYHRDESLARPWPYRRLLSLGGETVCVWMEPGKEKKGYLHLLPGDGAILEVWCSETEFLEAQANMAP
ncbi:MAG: DUF5804 family protein [Methanomicrobiaceae archaeon]|nr:DUF5804 family protein [Methanomicrobiaceae archaeon]